KIACAPAIDNEILILRLQDAPMDKVMADIATVTSGRWEKEGETSYLVPDNNVREMQVTKAQKKLATQIAETLKKQLATQPKVDDGKAPPQAVPAQLAALGVGSTELAKIAQAIGPDRLSMVPDDGRVVFSSNPTGMQQTLPEGAGPAIDQFIVDYNKIAASVSQDEPAKDEQSDPNVAALMDLLGPRMKKPQPIRGRPAKALVVASRRSLFGGFTLELKLYGENGKLLASNSLPLVLDIPFDPTQILNQKPAVEPATSEPEIELSPLSKEMHGMNGSMGAMQAGHFKFSSQLLAALKDPVAHDPLSFVESEALIAVAKQRHEQLVADLPDSVLSIFDVLTNHDTKLTATSFMKTLAGDDGATVEESAGWMVVSPASPVQARKQRTDRAALKTLIDSTEANGYPTLDSIAEYAQTNESPIEGAPASMTYIMVFAPGAMQQGMMGVVNWDLMRFYGQLGADQRQVLRQGGRIAFDRLSPSQQTIVSKMVFGADEELMVENRQAGAKPKSDPLTDLIVSNIEKYTGGNENDFRSEPTEVMPSGLPANGYVQVNFTSEPVGIPQTMSTDLGKGTAMDPMMLGMLKFLKDDPSMSQFSGEIPTMDDLKVGTRSVYNFSFYVAPDVSEKGVLNDDSIPKDAPVYKMANLPADFQKQIDQMADSFKNNPIWKMIGQMSGMGRQAVPPS
ncbi:MAG TPA: hypothetical protein VMI31_01505, partial [Fimbriimonadaceae bacterium]|nr:hypothetical protein [Fimbriimonadaceae bacterium]